MYYLLPFFVGVVGYPIAIKSGKNRKTHLNQKKVLYRSYYINLCLFSDIDVRFGNGGSLCGGSSCRAVG